MSLHDPPLPSPSFLTLVSPSSHLHLSFPSSHLFPFFACSLSPASRPHPPPSVYILHSTFLTPPPPFCLCTSSPSSSFHPPAFPPTVLLPIQFFSLPPIALPPFLLSLPPSTPSFSAKVNRDPVRSSSESA